jgi:hypothetical protein
LCESKDFLSLGQTGLSSGDHLSLLNPDKSRGNYIQEDIVLQYAGNIHELRSDIGLQNAGNIDEFDCKIQTLPAEKFHGKNS